MTKPSFIKDYLDTQEKYEKIYSKNSTLVLIQNGSFFEAYATNERGFDLSIISKILNYKITKKNKNIPEVSESNPYMLGFNIALIDDILKKLIDNNLTIVLIEEVSPPPKPVRKITGIYSPGTYIENINSLDSNYLVCLYINIGKKLNSTCPVYNIGMSAIELSIGKSIVYESFSKMNDINFSLDETIRFITNYKPKELVVFGQINEFVINYLELESGDFIYKNIPNPNKKLIELNYINNLYKKIYKPNSLLCPIEYLDLENYKYANVSFVHLLDYISNLNESLTSNIMKPIIHTNESSLILGNNAVKQLNILNNGGSKGLFDIVNNTSTAMGRRYLKEILEEPFINPNKINKRYDLIEILIGSEPSSPIPPASSSDNSTTPLYLKVENHLKYILDISRLVRRISLGIITPYELSGLYDSFIHVNGLLSIDEIDERFGNREDLVKNVDEFIGYFNGIFDYDELIKYNSNDARNIFKKELYKNIDELQISIENIAIFMNSICGILDKMVDPDKVFFKLKSNDKEGYYISTTIHKGKILQEKLKSLTHIIISPTLQIPVTDITFRELKNSFKINIKLLSENSNNINSLQTKLTKLINSTLKDILTEIFIKFNTTLSLTSKFISKLDFIKSAAKTAIKNNYIRPILDKQNYSYVSATNMRHPIVEKLLNGVEYVPHTISLGNKMLDGINGLLVYGLNGGGKSTIMKALGLNVIMAQCGMFVSASKFIFSPYKSLFVRITSEDNIYKGLSSFTLEMTELDSILKRNDANTLILGDEVCKGTESVSGTAIVAASICKFANSGASFIFATHLHEISEMKLIKELTNVKSVHISVKEENNMLIFDRELKPGSGDKIYGYLVAKYIIKDEIFINHIIEIKNQLLNLTEETVSKYNSTLYITSCQICLINSKDTTYDTHHINFQKDCKNNFVKDKPHIAKNAKANLVILCKKCHINVHKNKIHINGYINTTTGPILDYKILTAKSGPKTQSKKINETQIKYIKELKTANPKITLSKIKELCFKNQSINISLSTLSQIINNTY